ncbi:hypothetical protein J6590_053133 [Homalodisca vitripennis]|nr:hypothetical protein J6590_053133 [Homalodisca vitripennis]
MNYPLEPRPHHPPSCRLERSYPGPQLHRKDREEKTGEMAVMSSGESDATGRRLAEREAVSSRYQLRGCQEGAGQGQCNNERGQVVCTARAGPGEQMDVCYYQESRQTCYYQESRKSKVERNYKSDLGRYGDEQTDECYYHESGQTCVTIRRAEKARWSGTTRVTSGAMVGSGLEQYRSGTRNAGFFLLVVLACGISCIRKGATKVWSQITRVWPPSGIFTL